MSKACAWLAATFLVLGLVVGLAPLSTGSTSCGSAFHGSSDALVSDYESTLGGSSGLTDHVGECNAKRSTWRIAALACLVVAGGAVGAWRSTYIRQP